MADATTFQSNIHTHDMSNLTDYALFLGGLNVTHDALQQYDPLKTGFYRLFMIRKPIFVDNLIPDKMRKFKHILEYANTGVGGNQNITVQFNALQGGYTNKQMDVPNIATDEVSEFQIKCYEFSGSPIREVIQYWINGVTDIQTGLATYYGAKDEGNKPLPVSQANHTAEFIYVVTDQSGKNVEYACLFANCFPKEIKLDHFNSDSGEHQLVQMEIPFTCTRYMSPQINAKAEQLLIKYNVLMNSLNFNSGYSTDDITGSGNGSYYDINTGKLKDKTSDQLTENLNNRHIIEQEYPANNQHTPITSITVS